MFAVLVRSLQIACILGLPVIAQDITIKAPAAARAGGDALMKKSVEASRAGNQTAAKEHLSRAAEEYRKAAAASPGDLFSLLGLTRALEGTGQTAEAEQVLSRIRATFGSYYTMRLACGDALLEIGAYDEAIGQYRQALASAGSTAVLYEKRMIEAYMRQGKRDEAARVNEAILKRNPKDPGSRALAASFLIDRGEADKAIPALEAVVTESPTLAVAQYYLGRAYQARGEWNRARLQYQKALELRPIYPLARLGLAQTQVITREFGEALRNAREVLKTEPENEGARSVESAALAGMGKAAEARALLQVRLKQSPGSPNILYQLGTLELAAHNYEQAERAFRRVHALEPTMPRGLMGVVETFMARNKPGEAVALLEAEIAKSPARRPELQVALGNTALRSGRFDMAIAAFQKALAGATPGSRTAGDIYLGLGEACRSKGDWASSIAWLRKACANMPGDVAAQFALATTLDGAGRKREALSAYEAVLKTDPNHAVALNNVAFLMAETGGNLDKALEFAMRARQLLPAMLPTSDTLGWIYLKRGQATEAVSIFRDITKRAPGDPLYRYHLALALDRQGNRQECIQELKAALASNPPKNLADKMRELLAGPARL